MFVITKKDIAFYSIMSLTILLAIFAPITFINHEINTVTSQDLQEKIKIVVDAGHGEPDGGAVSANGIKESDLNLQIAQKLKTKLEQSNIEVVMTRESANNIAPASEQQNKIRQIKSSDLNNRVKIANESGAIILVSIHMNKFEDSKYRGWQTFYSKDSEEGKKLAESIQNSIGEVVQIENKRTALKIEGIKIIDKSKIPAVIVECGFLSNPEECKLLQDETYQEKMAEGTCSGGRSYDGFLGWSDTCAPRIRKLYRSKG